MAREYEVLVKEAVVLVSCLHLLARKYQVLVKELRIFKPAYQVLVPEVGTLL